VFANFLIGLREGLEAALIIGILIAYSLKTGRKTTGIILGALAAVLVSVLAGLALTEFVSVVPEGTTEIIAGITSILAVVFVTWMIFWMARQSRNLRAELHGKIDSAKTKSVTLVAVAFLAVIREGIETAIFIWSAARATGSDTNPVLGATIGLLVAAVLGYLVFKGALKLNLSVFFKYTGAFLILVAAGILAYGLHELQEVGLLPLLTQTSYDLRSVIEPNGVLDTLLRGTFSFRAAPSILETIAWLSYVMLVGWLYLKPKKTN
jgi:high-affinity iron transporter